MRKKRTNNVNIAILSTSLTLFSLLIINGGSDASAASLAVGGEVVAVKKTPAASATPAGPIDPKEVEAFADKYFGESLQKFNVPGAMFVVVTNGKVVLSKGYGFADKENKIPVDQTTVFRIGSISKTFTVAAVMQLVDQGKIKLHQDVQGYLGEVKIPNKTGKPLTMDHLLTHTSGFDFPYEKDMDASPDFLRKDTSIKDFLLDRMPNVVLTPGEAYQYDDFAYALAGYAVQNVTGMPFHQYMKEKMFKPLGMNSSHFLVTPELASRLATAYDPNGDPYPDYGIYPTDMPQGGMLSTGKDMATFMTMLLQKGKFGGKQIISEKSTQLMNTYEVKAHPTIPIATYGFEGLLNELANDQHVVGKGGNIPGFATWTWLLPEQNTGIFVVYNNDSELRLDLFHTFMDHYYPKTVKNPKTLPLNEKQATRYVGLYKDLHTPRLVTKISYVAGQLIAQDKFSTGRTTLKMIDPLLFEDESGQKVAFRENRDGSIAYMYSSSKDPIAYSQKMQAKKPFTDVPNESKYKSSIEKLHVLGIVNERTEIENHFYPKDQMTPAEFVSTLVRAVGYAPSNMKTGFTDIENNSAVKDIQAAAEHHLLNEESGDRFEPDRPITREEMAITLTRLHLPWQSGDKIQLAGQTDESALKAVRTLVASGVIDPDTIKNPDSSVDFRSKELLLHQEACYLIDKALFVP
ncbi:serine hydrolase [Brevibacillus laterosporus]|uniref:Penicillin-binding protein n=1 Tax=Brevibacillus laterosporus TaxID=1465 RepID=A0AAP8QBY3_BRELA|nr:serine hydrolase [Brevibacillus laterosporus]MED1664914.1 serine hydrolase [Brevibacillus laterosporus]MED1671496.1 serine hydrolase [Brevibacillus laterosporus]MED1717475.1 serine hydrolase [Brevibacillus laterosporus]PPA87572.1 penicillin-binding protein [Brevibacillus laterosporus]PPA93813.1 penicillin-binding protein [Brevibacillus laterosporus]